MLRCFGKRLILFFLEAAWIYLTRSNAPLDFGIGLGDDSQSFVIANPYLPEPARTV